MNKAAEDYFARPREELIGRVVWEVFPEAVGSTSELQLRRVAERGEPVEFETLAPAMRRWVAFRAYPSPEGGVSVYFRDVTDQRVIADALRASEARYRAVFDHAADATFLTSPTGEIHAANPAACRMLGRTEQEICALGRFGVVDLNDARLLAAIEERRRTGHVRAELTCVRADGTKLPVELTSAIFKDSDGQERTSLSMRDLTERKRAEDRLHVIADAGTVLGRTLDWQATLQDVTRLVVPRVADYCVVDLLENGELRRVAGSHRDPAREAGLVAVGAPGPVESRKGGIYKVARTGIAELVPEVDEAWLRSSTRDEAHFAAARANAPRSIVVVPLTCPTGTIGVLTLCLIDETRRYDGADLKMAQAIADRAALAIENARLYEKAVRAVRLREEVLGVVSHDLRNPLNAILLNAQLLRRRVDAPELGMIQGAVRRADGLIGDLLTASMLDGGALHLDRSPENAASLLAEAVDLHRAAADKRGLRLEVQADEGLPAVLVDRRRILQVVDNLIGNAMRFTPAGGRVSAEVRARGGEVAVSVSDTGPGIAPEAQGRVFDRFWHDKKSGGAGLGLAIAKGIVEAHGGTISVASTPGQGATFTFTLPVAKDAPG